jgi:hypothetical protein
VCSFDPHQEGSAVHYAKTRAGQVQAEVVPRDAQRFVHLQLGRFNAHGADVGPTQ